MSTFACALSGQTTIPDPVALPTGEICSKKLLLQKLLETSNYNPFHPSSQLDESNLVSLTSTNEILPPRTSNQNSIPSLLTTLSNEYDALVLELFDTRKALEETRKELSHALYQNDAAVRVIARVVMERDMARRELANVSANINGNLSAKAKADANVNADADADDTSNGKEQTAAELGNKRKRVEEPADPSGDATVSASVGGIPETIKKELKQKWSDLSSSRKAKTKATEGYATTDDISSFSALKKSYHKTSAKGIIAMVGDGNAQDGKIVTSSTDKNMTLYDWKEGKVLSHMNPKDVAGGGELLHCVGETIAMVGTDGALRIFVDGKVIAPVEGLKLKDVVGVKVHPTGKHVFVAEMSGSIHLFEVDVDNGTMVEAAVWNGAEGEDKSCTAIGLHPDGLILAIGRENGKIGLWDLNTEKLATTLAGSSSSTIATIGFSEKGVHLAAVDADGTIAVWDLRKQKSITSISVPEGAGCVSFCPIGKYFAYGTTNGDVVVTVVKDWEKKMVLSDGKGKVTGLVWGKEAKNIAASQSTSRMVKFWGN